MTEKTRVCFLVGSIAISGGTYVIFQHASHLQNSGYDVTLAVQEPFTETTAAWHDQGKSLRCIPFDQARAEAFDLVIATWWKTALELASFNAPRYGYFVQSIESRFYPEHERPLRALVDATYRLPVSYITEAAWILQHLKHSFGQEASLVRNGIRKDIYTGTGPAATPRSAGNPRVLIEGHFNIAFKNTALALRLAKRAGAKDIWVMTGSPVKSLPGVSRVFSRIPIHKTPEIYRSCDILVKLSTVEGMFGPPLEIFHCGGTALVFDVTGYDEYIEDGMNATVVRDRDIEQVVAALRRMLSDRQHLETLKQGAQATAATWPDWKHSSEMFAQWVENALVAPRANRESVVTLTKEAWSQYATHEQQRLKQGRSTVWRYKLKAITRRMPTWVQDRLVQLLTLKEVVFPPRKAS
ncbi:glycosyltransferase [Shinella sp.]|uniref:glycosyltransferase n=1 Tax=Shinella sp. TaxID=1870904 RepID=UPI00289E3C14|nr:glycosyltransferase [Shinella sp.]